MHDLEEQQANLEKEILIEKSKTAVVLSEKEIREFYEQALRLEPQMLINYLVKEILVYDDEIVIKYNTPTTISPDESQGFSLWEFCVAKQSAEYIPRTAETTCYAGGKKSFSFKQYKVYKKAPLC